MNTLNLTANTPEEKTVLEHLIPQVSDVLAEKINNGVYIEKDGKRLLNKKDLTTFMNYASEQAKTTIAESQRTGKQAVCVHGDQIMNWAIHYFEEDSIEGKLYNEYGTEYTPPKPVYKPTSTNITTPKPEPKPQLNIFDMLPDGGEPKNETPTEPVADEQPKTEPKEISPIYQHYLSVKEKYKDCIVFYRLGDFYEMYENDAVTAADVLNLTLTSRDYGLDERIPMVGIPFHASDIYLSKLVAAGYKVAVCELLEGNKERTVERIITPTATEPELDEEFDDDLTEEEMRKFDGDINEPNEATELSDNNDDFDLATEKERLKAFDTEALCLLGELFNNEIEIQ